VEAVKLTATGLHTHPAKLPRQRAVLELLSKEPLQPFRSQFLMTLHVFCDAAVFASVLLCISVTSARQPSGRKRHPVCYFLTLVATHSQPIKLPWHRATPFES